MKTLLIIASLIILCVLAIYFFRKLMESLVNLYILSKKKNSHDLTKQRNGIVLNKKTKKLEADQSLILPFE